MINNHDEIDNNAIERLHANQNRIQTPNNLFTNNEQAFFSNPNMVGKMEEEEEGALGTASGIGSSSSANFLKFFAKKKIGKWVALGIIGFFLLLIIIMVPYFLIEGMKGNFLGSNADRDELFGSTSGVLTESQQKEVVATISEFYKSSSISTESFFSDLTILAHNYNDYSYTDGDFDVAMIASTIHFNKFISDDTILSGALNDKKMGSNLGIARGRNFTYLPTSEVKGFYELAAVALGTDQGIPEEEFRGLAGHLVGSRVVSKCVPDPHNYVSTKIIKEFAEGSSLLDAVIMTYESIYYAHSDVLTGDKRVPAWYTTQMRKKIKELRNEGTFDKYYDTSGFQQYLTCGGNTTAVHYIEKYMNYEAYAEYLLNEYIPETYIECVSCSSSKKREDTIHIAYSIFNNRNLFTGLYYDETIDTDIFSNGDMYTTNESVYVLPDEIADNFTSPFGLTTSCAISSGFSSNRNGYSHYAVDAYANDRRLYATYDGVVDVVVRNIPNIYNQWNGGACVDQDGNMDYRSNGNFIRIKHTINGNTYYSYYMHMEEVHVSVGDTVKKGAYIGTEGNSGCSSGYHLHYQLQDSNGKRYDPSLLFAQCSGVTILQFDDQSLMEYLTNIYPKYSYTNSEPCIVKVYKDGDSGDYYTLTLEEYVAGVVNNEMGEGAGYESLKAQAVAARSAYIDRTNFCTTNEIVPNSPAFQTFKPIDLEARPYEIMNVLAARETQGEILTFSHASYTTMYSSYPCEKVYRCTLGVPYYFKDSGNVACRYYDELGQVHFLGEPYLYEDGNAEPGSWAEARCKDHAKSFYYCGSTDIPRQFANQLKMSCNTISADMYPHSNAAPYRLFPVALSFLTQAGEGYSNYFGHSIGMSQPLASYLVNYRGWDYKKVLYYFYTGDGTIDEDIINIEVPFRILDNVSEYEGSFSDDCAGSITLDLGYEDYEIEVPLDFYVAGNLANNFGARTNASLLEAYAITARTKALASSRWGTNSLGNIYQSSQYSYIYTEDKAIYDAINATNGEIITDQDGYIFEAPYYHYTNGTSFGSPGNERTTYELKYMSGETHKVTLPTKLNTYEGLSRGNQGLVYNVASYMANHWYFVDRYEVLQYFFGEDFNVQRIDHITTKGAVKNSNGTVSGTESTCNRKISSLNASLEAAVSAAGKGTLNGVLAAAKWVYDNSRNGDPIHLPYVLGGEYHHIGVNPEWGITDGLDCVGFVRWSIVNGYLKLPDGYNNHVFVYPDMRSFVTKNGIVGTDEQPIFIEFVNGSGQKNDRNVPLRPYVMENLIQPGDVLYHYSKTVYVGETEPSRFAHTGIVYKVDYENEVIGVLHSAGDWHEGIVYDEYSFAPNAAPYHSFTSVLRMSELEKLGYFE